MMENVETLKKLCLGIIATCVWRNRVAIEDLTYDDAAHCSPEIEAGNSRSSHIRFQPYQIINHGSNTIYSHTHGFLYRHIHRKNFQRIEVKSEKIETITNEINELQTLPKMIKFDICVSFIDLYDDVRVWYYQTNALIEDKQELMPYIHKCIIFNSTGYVNRENSIIKFLILTPEDLLPLYSTCTWPTFITNIARICDISKGSIEKYVRTYGIREQRDIEVLCAKISTFNLENIWNNQILSMIHRGNDIDNSIKAANGGTDVLKYFYSKVDENKKQSWLCNVLLQLINKKDPLAISNIVFISKRLDNIDVITNVIRSYGKELVVKLFSNYKCEESVYFYKILSEVAHDKFIDTLKSVFEITANRYRSFKYDSGILQQLLKKNLCRLWYSTSKELKNIYIEEENHYDILKCAVDDFDLIDPIVSDPDLTEENRKELNTYHNVLRRESGQFRNGQLLVKDNDSNIHTLHVDVDVLKRTFFKYFLKLNLSLLNDEPDIRNFKNEFRKDNNSVTRVIHYILDNERNNKVALKEVGRLLDWCFEDHSELMIFNTEVLISIKQYVNRFPVPIVSAKHN